MGDKMSNDIRIAGLGIGESKEVKEVYVLRISPTNKRVELEYTDDILPTLDVTMDFIRDSIAQCILESAVK